MAKVQYGMPQGQPQISNEDIARFLQMQTQLGGQQQGDQYDPLGAALNFDKPHPVYSPVQGIADVLGKVGESYFKRKQYEKAAAAQTANNQWERQATDTARNTGLAHDYVNNVTMDKGAFQGMPAFDPATMLPQQGPPQPSPNSSLVEPQRASNIGWDMTKINAMQNLTPQERTTMAYDQLAGKNAVLANAVLPRLQEAAQSAQPPLPKYTPIPEGGLLQENPDGTTKVVAGVPKVLPENTPLSPEVEAQKLRIAKAEKAPPAVSTKFAYDRTLGKNRSVTPQEEAAKPERYAPPLQAAQVKAYDPKTGNEVGTFDANDPALQKRIQDGEVTTQAPKQQTDQEKRSMGFANRMKNAEGDLTTLYEGAPAQGGKPAVPGNNPSEGFTGAIQNARVPWVQDADSSIVPNGWQSDAFQKEKRGKMEWMTAFLRKDSGATIKNDEYNAIDHQYFPQAGDSQELVAAKKKARLNAMSGVELEATPGNQSMPAAGRSPQQPPQFSQEQIQAELRRREGK